MSEQVRSQLSRSTRDWFSGTALSPSADAYIHFLTDSGYATSTVNSYLRCVAHFAHWSASQRLALKDIDEAAVASFLDGHLPQCRCALRCWRTRYGVRAALTHLLVLLRTEGLIAEKAPSLHPSITVELSDFDTYLDEVRGLQATTRQTRLRHVRAFLLHRFADGNVRLEGLVPLDIERFTMAYTARWKPSSVNCLCGSLRSYLLFKATLGIETSALMGALPHVAHWRLAGLPRRLSSQEIEQFLDGFDRTTATGRRDYAVARCYVDLGLRTVEVVRLQLDDVDWRAGTIQIQGKGGRIDKLPLPAITGQAIVDYLRSGRRQTPDRAVFLRHRPPLDKPVTPAAMRAVIRNAAQRCGLADRLTSTHLLRHTFACRLVSSGASLKAIADLMRHRNLDTTTIYAKVDFDALKTVAACWPGRPA